MKETVFVCNACGLACIFVVKHKEESNINKSFNGYCPFDNTPVSWYIVK